MINWFRSLKKEKVEVTFNPIKRIDIKYVPNLGFNNSLKWAGLLKESTISIKKRKGRFIISSQVFHTLTVSQIMMIFQGIIITQAGYANTSDATEYVGISPFFDEVDEGSVYPYYTCNLTFKYNTDTENINNAKHKILEGKELVSATWTQVSL